MTTEAQPKAGTRAGPAEEQRRSPGARLRIAGRLLVVPALALVAALAIGAVVMVASDPITLKAWSFFLRDPGPALSSSWALVWGAYSSLFTGSLGSVNGLSETIVAATPLLLAGLSVALGFQAGLFNIGAEGQMLAGSLVAAFVGFFFKLPLIVHLPLTLLAGFAGGALWGFVPGILKARTGAHEVITTIMLNFIALYLTDYALLTTVYQRPERTDPISKPIPASAQLPNAGDLRAHAGIFVALVAAAVVWWLLYRSTLGFRWRTVGANPSAAAYAGMSVAGTYVVVMTIAGGLAGLAGTANLLGVQRTLYPDSAAGLGFTAIALALLARAHPWGVVGAALLFGALQAGATEMQAATSTPVDIIVVIQALIIAFIAAPALVRAVFRVKAREDVGLDVFSKGWAG